MGNLLAAFKGIVTAPGYLVRDEASCLAADNVSFGFPGRVRPRTGTNVLAATTTGYPMKLLSSRVLGADFIANTASSLLGNADALFVSTSGGLTFAALNTIDSSAVANTAQARAAMAVCLKNHYVTSTAGVRRIESDFSAGVVRYAGMPRGLGVDVRDMDAAVYSVLSAGTLLPDGWARAYRVTWHKYDVDQTLLGGAPTGRVAIRNVTGTSGYASATSNVTVRIPLPAEWGTSGTALTDVYFWRLWGTKTWDTAAGLGDDECYLIDEAFIDATDISNGYAEYTDATPDAYLQGSTPLHTNAANYPPSDEGIRQGLVNADDPPPVAGDVAYHQDVMWYARTRLRTRQNFTLRAVGSGGFAVGDTVTLTGPAGTVVLTGVVGAPASPTEFMVELGLATTEENIEATTRNLVACAQRNTADWGGDAYHVSLSTSEPGLFFLELRNAGDTTMTFATTAAAGTFNIAELQNLERGNRLFFSKPRRADAVPPVNFIDVGSQEAHIERVSSFRDRLIVWTTEGIYQVTGSTFADFAASAFDLTRKIFARESVAAVDDRLYALCNTGVVELDDGGARDVSLPIDDFIQTLLANPGVLVPFSSIQGFGVGLPVEHEYRLFYIDPHVLVGQLWNCPQWLTFDTRTRAWSTGYVNYVYDDLHEGRSCGVVLPSSGRLVLGAHDPATVVTEGKYFYPSGAYSDVTYDGTEVGIGARLRFNFQAPNQEGLLHWQQCVAKFEQLPTTPTNVSFLPDENWPTASTVSISNAVSRLEERVEVPWAARRSTRMAVELIPAPTVPGPTEVPWDLAGLEIGYSSPTRFGRKTP